MEKTKIIIHKDKLCIKAKVYMLPTEKAENSIIKKGNQLRHEPELITQSYLNSINCTSYHLYITTDDTPSTGEWFYDPVNGKVANYDKFIHCPTYLARKIIATTDKSLTIKKWKQTNKKSKSYNVQQNIETTKLFEESLPQPSKEFIEAYCKAGGIDEVLVEVKPYHGINTSIAEINSVSGDGSMDWKGRGDNRDHKIKTDAHNTITIHSLEEKMYSREEVIILCKAARKSYATENISFEEWIEENLTK